MKALASGAFKKASPSTSTSSSSASSSSASSSSSTSTSLRRSRDHVDIPHTNIRKVIASRLSQSKQTIPHAYTSITCTMDNILKLRNDWKQQGITPLPSVNDLVIRASALALRNTPEVNTIFDNKSQTFAQVPTVDISVAVATDTGLITPILKNADRKRLNTISSEVKVSLDT